MSEDSALARAKQVYASGMQLGGRVLTRSGVLGSSVPPLSHRRRHWAYSLTKVHDSLELARLDVPWWTYSAIDAVSVWLSARQTPVRVFEYGSGASTLWLARRADEVHSVEHHVDFGAMMTAELAGVGNVSLQVVAPVASGSPKVPSGKENYAGLDFADYVAAIDNVEGEFDIVVIDGRARQACLAAALPRLAARGLVIFDNSSRRRYRPAIAASPLPERVYRGLTPTLPYPEQTSLLVAG